MNINQQFSGKRYFADFERRQFFFLLAKNMDSATSCRTTTQLSAPGY
jgi:hypothetical protein